MSSSNELEKDFGVKVESIVNLDTLIKFVEADSLFTQHLSELNNYRDNWGA